MWRELGAACEGPSPAGTPSGIVLDCAGALPPAREDTTWKQALASEAYQQSCRRSALITQALAPKRGNPSAFALPRPIAVGSHSVSPRDLMNRS
ncbi:hypothetical protein VUR80DRAFT_7663 [Thermomyces stellatus]